MPIRPLRTALVAGATATAAIVLAAGPALAHVEPDPGSIPAGEATTVALTIGHGCDESSTTSVAVQLPDGLETASGVATSGWAIDSSDGVVTWTADPGEELPTDESKEFELELTPAEDQVGETLFLKTVQTCEEGELRWIEEWDGEGEEPEHPAPSVEVLAVGETATAAGDHHAEEGGSDHAETDTTEAGHHAEETATTEAGHEEEAASEQTSDDDSNTGAVALVVLVIAAVGLGGVALVRSRRSTP